jgi:predicted nuclease of predicted toxin-antitoxin system
MKFKIDENLPLEIAELLRVKGYEAKTVVEQALNGEIDHKIASVCQEEKRVLITLDTDFADIRTYPPENFPGIIVLRLRQQDKVHILEVFKDVMVFLSTEPLEHTLWIIDENRIRIRGA